MKLYYVAVEVMYSVKSEMLRDGQEQNLASLHMCHLVNLMKKITYPSSLLFTLLAIGACQTQKPVERAATAVATPLWQSEAYALYPDSVVQGEHVARILSPTALPLQKGRHTISPTFELANENMHGEINQAMVDNMRVIRIR